jgi:S-adenosylmethionine/arginine decarboxylase-like enzyme
MRKGESMKDLAPEIVRQRLLIEGKYEIEVQIDTINQFFDALLSGLGLSAAGDAIVNSSLGQGQPKNQGIEAFLPLIDSGVAVYTWQSARFLSLIIYTCKTFEKEKALQIVEGFFELSQMEHKSF